MAEELFSLYHGGMQEDANLSTIDPYKVAIKQNRRGKPTQSVGFYMSSDPAVANRQFLDGYKDDTATIMR